MENTRNATRGREASRGFEIYDRWMQLFREMTGPRTGEAWGLEAAIVISRFRKEFGHAPTFRELFQLLLPESGGLPGPWPEGANAYQKRKLISVFRLKVMEHWRRHRWLTFTRETRSLSTGAAFWYAAAARARARKIQTANE